MANETIISQNPMTKKTLWTGNADTKKSVDSAVKTARAAFPSWSSLTLEERTPFLYAFKKALEKKRETFAEMISMETGKPRWESLEEVAAMIAKVDISIDAQQHRCPTTRRPLPDALSVTRHNPLGVMAVLGPYNFPGHLPNGHIIPALLAGNTVVFKPSELTPWVGEALVNLWKETGLPSSVLNLVQGGGTTGHHLSAHPDINALLFTGSWKTGQVLAKQFGNHPDKLLALEMGGNNPLVIGDITDFQAAAYTTILSAFLSAGQRCTCARRLILPEGKIGDSLLSMLLEMTPKIRIGAFTDDPEPFMGPVISQQAAEKLLKSQNTLIAAGGKPLTEMQWAHPGTPLLTPGIIDVTAVVDRPDEELFGPLLQVIRVPNFATAISEANRSAYGLSAAILTNNREQYEMFYKNLRSGTVNWNRQTTGASSAAPFGGVGHSGNYRPSAYYAADYCNYPVASLESETLNLPKILKPGIDLSRGDICYDS